MGDWGKHGSSWYKCNFYEKAVAEDGEFAAEEAKRVAAKNQIQWYMWCYERYFNHDKSERYATNLLPKLKMTMQILVEQISFESSEVKFLEEACKTVISGRKMLKWTYAWTYFRKEKISESDQFLFQEWQQHLEDFCDRLQEMIE